jgi:ATP-dependent protease HslVU (ClpYQ) peptidase subunit
MKTALRLIALVLAAFIGLWVLGHGIVVAAQIHALLRENQDIVEELVESSVSIAGGICVLSVAVEQLYCWRAHRKEDSLI